MTTCETVWKAWEGDEILRLDFPPGWRVQSFDIGEAPPLDPAALQTSFDHPVGAGRLEDRLSSRGQVAIAVEDLTRPLYLGDVLGVLIERIARLGFRDEEIRILLSVGAHHPMLRGEQVRKLGAEIVARFAVENHHPYENLVDCGISHRGTPVRLNRTFLESDYRILVGGVLPHPYTGFGGGAKLLVPGLSGIETVELIHRAVVTGRNGSRNPSDANPTRAEIEAIAEKVGIDYAVHLVTGRRRALVGCVVGDLVQAHRAAVRIARQLYQTVGPSEPVDVLVLNAYPKDTEMLQVGHAFNVLRTGPELSQIVHPQGSVVVLAACPHGRGYHSIHQPGGRVYRSPVQRRHQVGERDILLLSEGANLYDFHVSFWSGYRFYTKWDALRRDLESKHGRVARVAVFHAAPLQLVTA